MELPNSIKDAFGLRILLHNRQLLSQLLRRRIAQEHRSTWLGRTWIVAKPLALMALYVFVFGYIFEGKFTEGANESKATYALAIFLGLNVIHLITDVLALSARCIADNESMVKRTTIALEIIPASIVGTAAFHFVVGLSLSAIGLFALGHPPTIYAFWMLPIIVCLTLGALGLSYLVAVVGCHVRDITQIIPVLNLGLLFSSAVFYPIEQIPSAAWAFLKFNPILHAVEATRSAMLWGEPIAMNQTALFFGLACISTYAIGYYLFSGQKHRFADIL